MSRMKQELREAMKAKLPGDRWRVEGVNRYGEPCSYEFEFEDSAQWCADKMNDRKPGSVKVVHLVYDGPKAAWVPVDRN